MVARGVICAARAGWRGAASRRACPSTSAAGWSRRRRQFGCSSIVPGTFGCSASPRMSSIGISASGPRRPRREADRRIDGGCGIFGTAARSAAASPALRNAPHSAERSCARSCVSRCSSATRPSACACRDIGALPPARNGRQIMRGRHRDRIAAPSGRREKRLSSALEPEHVHAGDAGLGEPLAERRLDRAEVFGDHHRTMAMRLERQQAQEIVDRIGEISAVLGGRALRNQPEARQAHRVIDAHAAGMRHGGAQGRDERLEAVRDQGLRREAGQAPILPARVEQIGRRADIQAEQQVLLARPGMAAAGSHPDRKIGDQARCACRRRARPAARARSCAPRSIAGTGGIGSPGSRPRRSEPVPARVGARQSVGPVVPVAISAPARRTSADAAPRTARARAADRRRRARKTRNPPSTRPPFATKSSNSRRSSAYFARAAVGQSINAPSCRPRRSLRGGDAGGAEHEGRIGKQRIEKQPARGRVGSEVRGIGGKQAVRRAERDRVRTFAAPRSRPARRARLRRRIHRRPGAATNRAEPQAPTAGRPVRYRQTVTQRGGATASVISRFAKRKRW